MLTAFALLLASASAPAPTTVRILVLDIKAESVAGETARALRDTVVVELARAPQLSVLSTEDLRAAVSIESESRAMGCDTTSCLAEVGQALGARYIVHGSVAKVGNAYAVYLNLFDTDKNEALAREAVDADSEGALLAAVRRGTALIRDRVAAVAPAPSGNGAAGEEPLEPMFVTGVVVAGVGALATVIGGVIALGAAGTIYNFDNDPDARKEAQTTGVVGSVVAGLGVVVLGVGGTIAALQVME
jgi:TolB-like protein